jgi:hypothetical protein
MKKITTYAIDHMIDNIFVKEDHSKDKTILTIGTLGGGTMRGISKSYTEDEIIPRIYKEVVNDIDHDTKIKIGEQFFQNLADFLTKTNQTILKIVNPKIYDKVLNAKEYQLLKYKHLYKLLEAGGFAVTSDQKQSVDEVCKPFLDESVEINNLIQTLANYGSTEIFPKSNQHINYRSKFTLEIYFGN